MSISLIKGQKVDLTKNIRDLNYIHIGVDWEILSGLDIDASAFLLDENDKVVREEDFIFYGQPESDNGAVRLEDSISTIEKQRFITSLENIAGDVQKISFTLTIYEAKLKNFTFADVENIKLRIINSKTGEEIAVFPITYSFTKESAIVLGTLYRFSNEWKFHAVGAGFNGGLAYLCEQFGLNVIEEIEASSQQMENDSTTSRFKTVQERNTIDKGEVIPPQPIEQVELTRSPLVQFDIKRIAELSRQSTNLVDLFEEERESNHNSVVNADSSESIIFNAFDDTEADHKGFIDSLAEIEKTFLKNLTPGQISVEEAHKFFRKNFTMPAVFLNAINEKANEHLGENLLIENNEWILVDEEFTFIVERIEERSGNEY